MKTEFNPEKIYITNVLQKTGRPVSDAQKGLINPLILKISKDTLKIIKQPKENICEKCFAFGYCPDKDTKNKCSEVEYEKRY